MDLFLGRRRKIVEKLRYHFPRSQIVEKRLVGHARTEICDSSSRGTRPLDVRRSVSDPERTHTSNQDSLTGGATIRQIPGEESRAKFVLR